MSVSTIRAISILLLLASYTLADLPSCARAKCVHCAVDFIDRMCPTACAGCKTQHQAIQVSLSDSEIIYLRERTISYYLSYWLKFWSLLPEYYESRLEKWTLTQKFQTVTIQRPPQPPPAFNTQPQFAQSVNTRQVSNEGGPQVRNPQVWFVIT